MKRLFALFMLASFCSHAYSDRACFTTSGTPAVTTFIAHSALSSSDNTAGKLVISDSQNVGKTLTFSCECSDSPESAYHYWSGTSDFPVLDNIYMQLTPELKVSTEIWINSDYLNSGGGNYYSLPFSAVKLGPRGDCGEQNKVTGSAYAVRMGIVITKPFVGNLSFHGPIGKVYLRRDANPVNPADPPLSIINLDLDLTVPENCTVRPGGVINIDLGQNIRQGQFKGQPYPLPPKSYTPRSFDLTFDCNFSNADLDVTLVGDRDAQLQGFASSSPDVSVIVMDNENNIVKPDSFAGDVNINSDNASTTLHLKAYPTNSGSNAVPAAGSYSATATILLSYK